MLMPTFQIRMSRSIGAALVIAICFVFGGPLCRHTVAEDGSLDEWMESANSGDSVDDGALCDDATFLRRVTLDLMGRVPTESELDRFQLQPDREAIIDRWLSNEQHAQFWSHLWTVTLIGRGEQRYVESELLRQWIEAKLQSNTPLNQVGYELISATGVSSLHGPASFAVANRDDPVMRLSRVFLGVRLDCAQCHDHPYARWTNDDYVAMQRFFEPMRFREVSGGIEITDAVLPKQAKKPVFLTGRMTHTTAWRQELAGMVVQSKPFSRAMVDRVWHWLMGERLLEFPNESPSSDPVRTGELLEKLAAEFRNQGYQLRPLIRRICLSKAYQRATGSRESASMSWPVRRRARPMLPEQWVSSVALVLGEPLPHPETLSNRVRKLLSLTRQKGPFQSDPFSWDSTNQTLVRQLALPIDRDVEDVGTSFRKALARMPTPEELELVSRYSPSERIYALLHSNEFVLND